MPRRSLWLSSPFMSPPLLIIVLPIITFMVLFFAVPSLLSATSHVLRPTSVVKKSWDSLNILLVIFAILCGVFARRNDDESSPREEETIAPVPRSVEYHKMTQEEEDEEERFASHRWFGFSEERKIYDAPPILLQSPATGVTRLRRSSSSYPDLRQESSWETGADRFKFRYFDDFEIDKFCSPSEDQLPEAVDHRRRSAGTEEEANVKEIPVDTFEIRSSPPKPPARPPPPPPPPPPAAAHCKPRRTYQTVPHKKKVDNGSEVTELNDDEFTRIRSPPPPSPPTPPPPRPQSVKMRSDHRHGKGERRKSNVKREIAMVWASVLSNQRKRKKKQMTKSNHNNLYDDTAELPNNTRAPPPPPPPPPPPSVFHNLFRKGLGKTKKVHSVSTPPPPPPPPPLTSSRRWSKSKSQIPPRPPPAPPTPPPEPLRRQRAGRPPLPTKVSNFNEETINTGNQSPLIPVPPPPPPFKMPVMKFVVRGDFVKIHSNQSSRCSSPERGDTDGSSTMEESETTATVTNPITENGEAGGAVFCPSPDVNVKAATFIARLRGEWKLEKLNSMKEKGNLGLHSGPLPFNKFNTEQVRL